MAAIGRRRWRGRSNQGATDHAVRLSTSTTPRALAHRVVQSTGGDPLDQRAVRRCELGHALVVEVAARHLRRRAARDE